MTDKDIQQVPTSCSSGASVGDDAAARVRERPIIFSAPMVRAILTGRKTQTRRIVKPQPNEDGLANYWEVNPPPEPGPHDRGYWINSDEQRVNCPYGVPGDRLWVRETWEHVHPCQIDAGRFSIASTAGIPGPPPVAYRVIYRADGEYPRLHFSDSGHPYRERCQPGCTRDHTHPEESWNGWRSPIHMPRWASRITLELTEVRVERLHDITEEHALAEGCAPGDEIHNELFDPNTGRVTCAWVEQAPNAKESFCNLWQRIHRVPHDEETAWERDDWVWALTFKRVTP